MWTLGIVNVLFYCSYFPEIKSLVVSFTTVVLQMSSALFFCIKPSRHHKFQRHHDFAALTPEFEIIHGCMSWEAELGPITRDEKKVIVGCSLERIPLQRERRYQHSHLIIRPHSESWTPRPGRILKLKGICWHGRRSHSQHQHKKHPNQPTWQIQVVPTSNAICI